MTNPNKTKGDRAELEAARHLEELLGFRIRRKLGAGRQDDTGDLDGIPDTTIQIANWKDVTRALRTKPIDAQTQSNNAGTTYAATLIRLHGGHWRAVLTLNQYATYIRNTLSETP